MEHKITVPQPSNPTDQQRHELLLSALKQANRTEDYYNIIELLSPTADVTNFAAPGEFKGIKIGIIGGGLAGLSTAFELRKLGFDITIFDAEEGRIGGRVYTYYFDKEKKLYGELGAIRIPVSHETTWHYINLFKLDTHPFIQNNPNTFIYVKNTRTRNTSEDITEKIYPKFNLTRREKNVPWSEFYKYVENSLLMKLHPEIRKQIFKILPIYSPEYLYLNNINTRQAFEMLGLSQEAIDLISSLKPFDAAFMYKSYNETLQENYPVNFSYLYQIDGGNANLPLAFYNSLVSENPPEYININQSCIGRVAWKGGHWVNGIYMSEDRKVILKYRNKYLSEDMAESFDYIVCTIPFSTLREIEIKPLFSNRKMQAIREINYMNAQRTLFLCNHRFWEEDKAYGRITGGVSYTDMPIGTIIYPSENRFSRENYSLNEKGVLIASYNFNLDAIRLGAMDNDKRFELIKRQVEEVHGLSKGYLDTVVESVKTINWNDEQWFKGAFAVFNTEQKPLFSYDMLKPEYGNKVFFAGEHTSTNHTWMQGALYTGMNAANMLVHCVKKHKMGF